MARGAALPARGAQRGPPSPTINRAARRREPALDLLLRGLLPGHRPPGGGGDRPHPALRRRAACSRGGLTLGALVAFIQYSERFWRPISDLSEKFNILQAAMASSERIFTLLDTPAEVVAPAAARARCAAGARAGAASRTCWFALREPGRARAGCCGTSTSRWSRAGAWPWWAPPARARPRSSACWRASTTCSRAASPWTAWTCASSTRRSCASSLALVLQDVHLFSGTIASNIRLGSDIPDERVRAAARAVHAAPLHRGAAPGLRRPRCGARAPRCPWARSSSSPSRARWPTTRAC